MLTALRGHRVNYSKYTLGSQAVVKSLWFKVFLGFKLMLFLFQILVMNTRKREIKIKLVLKNLNQGKIESQHI